MKITLLNDSRIRLENAPPPLTIEAITPDQGYSPFHMLASGLAMCTHAVLHSWAMHAKLGAERLVIEVGWEFGEKPQRVAAYDIRIDWPDLPEDRKEAARRAARLCAAHATFMHPPAIALSINSQGAAA